MYLRVCAWIYNLTRGLSELKQGNSPSVTSVGLKALRPPHVGQSDREKIVPEEEVSDSNVEY